MKAFVEWILENLFEALKTLFLIITVALSFSSYSWQDLFRDSPSLNELEAKITKCVEAGEQANVPRDFATWSCMYFYHPTNK